ncbi:MAG: DUF1648 domain-containing protein [Bacteroidota bacterium]
MSQRPKLNLPLTSLDWLYEGAAVIVMAFFVWSLLDSYADLPETIPTHFNHKGEADGFSSKSSLWLLPGIAFATYLGLIVVNRMPHKFNYPIDITEENAAYQYRLATRMIRVINLSVVVIFYLVAREILLAGFESQGGMGGFLLPIILLLTLFPIIVYLILASRA